MTGNTFTPSIVNDQLRRKIKLLEQLCVSVELTCHCATIASTEGDERVTLLNIRKLAASLTEAIRDADAGIAALGIEVPANDA